jgi:hypothetical protein
VWNSGLIGHFALMKMQTGTLSVDTFNSWVRSKKEIVAGLLLASTLSIIFYHGSGSSGLRATQGMSLIGHVYY